MPAMTTREDLRDAVAEFARRTENAQIEFMRASRAGRKIFGIYCGFAPSEIVWACGGIPVSLCGDTADAIPAAEVDLPRNFCPLIKSSYGLAITDTCPFFHFSDALIGETTCDGKKKVFELLGDLKPVHVMQLPPSGPLAMEQWRTEVDRVIAFVESVTGNTLDYDELRYSIDIGNKASDILQRIASSFELERPPLTWNEMLVVQSAGDFLVDRESYITQLERLADLIDAWDGQGASTGPRVLITGTPMSPDTNKVMRMAEDAGARVVCHDACSGIKMYDRRVATDVDPVDAITEATITTPCACISPNPGRFDLLDRSVTRFGVDGVIDSVWLACHTFNVESVQVGRHVRDDLELPYLKIETDYGDGDLGQLQTRIEAFVERL